MGLFSEFIGGEGGLALDVDNEVKGTGEGGILSAFVPHVHDAVPPVDGLAGDRLADGNDGHAVEDMVEPRAHGDRGPDHTGEDRARAGGLVSGFDGVKDIYDAGLFTGSGDVEVDGHEGA